MRYFILSILACFLISCSGCGLGPKAVTPELAEAASFQMFVESGQGTAWAINEHTLVTAGHMCESLSDQTVLVSTSGRRFHGTIIVWDQLRGSYMSDLCLVHTDYPMTTWLKLARNMPEVGDTMGYAGFPNGVFMVSAGVYMGDMDGPDQTEQDYTFSAWADHGASGSGLYSDKGVWGVLVRLRVNFHIDGGFEILGPEQGGVAIPLQTLKAFLDDAGADYTVVPA